MISRTDRKRPSAVLEDRLGSDHFADLDSSSFSYLQIETNCEKNRLLSGDNEILNSGCKTFFSKPALGVYVSSKDGCRDSFEKLNKSKSNLGYISMASSPSKSKPDISSSTGTGPTNNGHDNEDIIHLKVLVPSVAAGAIIGKGGETIADAQAKSGAKVKMSKSNDYYPGTNERVCLITGTVESVSMLLEFIMDKIRHKPDPNAKPAIDFDNKVSAEREKQVKAIIPNSTAGMIIGKGGAFIKQLKDESGAFIQLSQKSKDTTLQERVLTVIGEPDCNRKAMSMIIDKIQEDPQSGSCLNISYSDVQGLVANFNPTGSPYANSDANGDVRPASSAASNGGKHGYQRGSTSGAMSPNSSNVSSSLPSNECDNIPSPFVLPLQGGGSLQLRFNMNTNRPPTDPALMSQYLDHIKATLRSSGYYSDLVVDDIAQAINVLSSHGILVVNLVSPTPATNNTSPSHAPISNQQTHHQTHHNMSSSSTSSPNGIIYRSTTAQPPLPTTPLMQSAEQLPNQIMGSAIAASINDGIMSNRQNHQQLHHSFQSSQPHRNSQQTHQQGTHHPQLFATSNNGSLSAGSASHGQLESHQMNSFGLIHANNHSNHSLTTGGTGGNMYATASPRQPTTYWTPASPGTMAGSSLVQNGNAVSESGANGVGGNESLANVTARMVGSSIAAAVAHQQHGGLLPLDSSNTSSINLSSSTPTAGSSTLTGALNSTTHNLPEPFRGGPSASPFSQQHALSGTMSNQLQSKYSSSSGSSQPSTTFAATSSALVSANGAPSSPQVAPIASIVNHQQGNKNSFGLGTVTACPPPPGLEEQVDQVELEINESIIGAVIGPSGKSIVDIQQFSCARIQISKKGTFSPGTRNRIVTIQGPPKAISTAKFLIEKKIVEEENKRERNSNY